jgi:hypothetical protein
MISPKNSGSRRLNSYNQKDERSGDGKGKLSPVAGSGKENRLGMK